MKRLVSFPKSPSVVVKRLEVDPPNVKHLKLLERIRCNKKCHSSHYYWNKIDKNVVINIIVPFLFEDISFISLKLTNIYFYKIVSKFEKLINLKVMPKFCKNKWIPQRFLAYKGRKYKKIVELMISQRTKVGILRFSCFMFYTIF